MFLNLHIIVGIGSTVVFLTYTNLNIFELKFGEVFLNNSKLQQFSYYKVRYIIQVHMADWSVALGLTLQTVLSGVNDTQGRADFTTPH